MTKEELAKQFPDGYWDKFKNEFSHCFWQAHSDRTIEYDETLGEKIASKMVLEVGGFPGLEAAWLLSRDADVDVIDSPDWTPDYYNAWRTEHGVGQCLHDITKGAPPYEFFGSHPNRLYDVAIMSDVLLHIDGFPFEFMEWFAKSAKELILINYQNGSGNMEPAKGHNLKSGFQSIPSTEMLIAFMVKSGAKHKQTIELKSSRTCIIFEGKK